MTRTANCRATASLIALALISPYVIEAQNRGDPREAHWRFTVWSLLEPRFEGGQPSIRVSSDSLEVSGQITTHCGTEVVSGEATRRLDDNGTDISLVVRALPLGNACLFVETYFEYELSIPIERPGPHHVRVFHVTSSDFPANPVLDFRIDIPGR